MTPIDETHAKKPPGPALTVPPKLDQVRTQNALRKTRQNAISSREIDSVTKYELTHTLPMTVSTTHMQKTARSERELSPNWTPYQKPILLESATLRWLTWVALGPAVEPLKPHSASPPPNLTLLLPHPSLETPISRSTPPRTLPL